MSLSCGLVGLPNVGKSTLFNAILKKSIAIAENYPFCTIEPNIGKVPLEDERLNNLSLISSSNKIINALLTCVDIAGLVKGANEGEGLGNKFLANIRECDLIIHVLRCFDDDNIIHVNESIDPIIDFETINFELQISDLSRLEKILEQKKVDLNLKNIANEAKVYLEDNKALRDANWSKEFISFFNLYGFITFKPMLVVANVSEDSSLYNDQIKQLNAIKVMVSLESMLQDLTKEEKSIFLKDINIEYSGLNDLLKIAYERLGLISYFTTGKEETRAWTVKKGDTMQVAAGVIHTDFSKHFISADVVKYEDFIINNGWSGVREKGLIKTCSKDTLVEDGDICLFKSYK